MSIFESFAKGALTTYAGIAARDREQERQLELAREKAKATAEASREMNIELEDRRSANRIKEMQEEMKISRQGYATSVLGSSLTPAETELQSRLQVDTPEVELFPAETAPQPVMAPTITPTTTLPSLQPLEEQNREILRRAKETGEITKAESEAYRRNQKAILDARIGLEEDELKSERALTAARESRMVLPGTVERKLDAAREMNVPEEAVINYYGQGDRRISESEYEADRKAVRDYYTSEKFINKYDAAPSNIEKFEKLVSLVKSSPSKYGNASFESLMSETAANFDPEVAEALTLMKQLGLEAKNLMNYTGPMSNYENEFFVNLIASFKNPATANINKAEELQEIQRRWLDIVDQRRKYATAVSPDTTWIDDKISEYKKLVPYAIETPQGRKVFEADKFGISFEKFLKDPEFAQKLREKNFSRLSAAPETPRGNTIEVDGEQVIIEEVE